MINITEYLKNKGLNANSLCRRFFRLSRVKYIVASDEKFSYKRTKGRTGATYMSEDMFIVMKDWIDKKPLPLLNRKEYEVAQFITAYFGKEVISQYKLSGYFLDWYVPSLNLAIEFDEKEHSYKKDYDKKRIDYISKTMKVVVINENTVMQDLAILAKQYKVAYE